MKTKISALIWLISVITLSTTVGIAEAQPVANVWVSLPTPPQSPTVNSVFYVEITIAGPSSIEVYAWAVKLRCEPYLKALNPLWATEGPFLPSGGPTLFAYVIDHLYGEINIANVLLIPRCTGGVSCGPGPRLLAEVYFQCLAQGQTWIEFVECQLFDCDLNPIDCICHDLTNLNQQP